MTEGSRSHWLPPYGGVDKPIHIEPLVALVEPDEGTLPFACPDAPDDRLEANPMFIHRPQLHLRVRMGALDLLDLFRQLVLERLSAS